MSDVRCQMSDLNRKSEIGNRKLRGFTLVELMVSLAITSLLMLGLSVFFSSTFSQLFQASNQATNTQRQFAVNQIVRNKFENLKALINSTNNSVFIQSEITKNQLPFSFIGMTPSGIENHLAFKDVFLFNKIYASGATQLYADSGNGVIRNAEDGQALPDNLPANDDYKNFTSFTIAGGKYYVVLHHKNKVMECTLGGSCNELNFSNKPLHPTDITKDNTGKLLFISGSENGRIIKYDIDGPSDAEIMDGLNYPTGIAFYDDGEDGILFVSDTLNHKVQKIDLTEPETMTTIAGEGSDETCNSTAKFCKLYLPTGLFVNQANNELFIADSGNNRILKVTDPPQKADLTNLDVEFNLGTENQISKIDFTFPNSTTGVSNIVQNSNDLHPGKYESSDPVLTYKLSVPITSSTINTNCIGDPLICTDEFTGFDVGAGDNIFSSGDLIKFEGDPDTYTIADPSGPITVQNNSKGSGFAPGTLVKIINTFSVSSYIFNFDLAGITTLPTGFQNIKVQAYDEDDVLIEPETTVALRIGDGNLGTIEDKIEIFEDDSSIIFPTGVSDGFYVNSGTNEIVKFSGGSQALNVIDPTYFSTFDFDYVSEFPLASDLVVSKYDADGAPDKILELEIDFKTSEEGNQIYKINATLP